mgnify:CR=1 FL=1
MRSFFIALSILVPALVFGQDKSNYSALPLVPYKPFININGIDQRIALSRTDLLKYGLKVVLADKSFKVKEFHIVYDCHSRAYFDFSVKRYIGDSVDTKDSYLQNRIWVGDIITFECVVIEKAGSLFVMKNLDCWIIN